MKKSTRVLVSGPLEPFAAGYQRELFRQGYSRWTVVSYLYSLARVSRWLAGHGLTAADLDAECVGRFLAERRADRRVQRQTPRGLNSLLSYLSGLGLSASTLVPRVPGTARDGQEVAVAGGRTAVRGQHHVVALTEDAGEGTVDAGHVAAVGHAHQGAATRGVRRRHCLRDHQRPVVGRGRGPHRPARP